VMSSSAWLGSRSLKGCGSPATPSPIVNGGAMDSVFERAYSEQFRAYRAVPSTILTPRRLRTLLVERRVRRRAIKTVDEAIRQAMGRLGTSFSVRSDARLFLMVNLTELVAVPLLSVGSQGRYPSDIQETLTSDAITIVQAAREYANEGQLSAAAILFAAARVLPNLRLKDWRLWDRS